jgi:hypothetical protein
VLAGEEGAAELLALKTWGIARSGGGMAPADNEETGVEQQLREAILTGQPVDLRTGHPEQDDPARAGEWEARRVVAAALLADLLTSPGSSAPPKALRLAGARIVGVLDLEAATLICPLLLCDCSFEQHVNLVEAQAPAVRLPGCHLPVLYAAQLKTRGNVELGNGFTARGVDLSGAHIGGNLTFSGDDDGPAAHLSNPGGHALFAQGLTVDGNMWCRAGFTADGEVDLMGARIGAELSFSGSNLTNPGGIALQAQGVEVGQDLKCRYDVTIDGMVSLAGAHIHGDLNMFQATLTNPEGTALYAQGLTVGRDMDCSGGFTAQGEINLLNAHIGSNLVLDGARLTNLEARVLHADGLAVDQNMFCRWGFTAQGEVRLLGANIRGTLGFEDATLTNPSGWVLDLERGRMATLFLRPKVRPEGTVELINAQVDACYDDEATWPQDLRLVGFTYGALVAEPEVDATARLRWLELDAEGYSPQPYEQLAAVYRRAGRDQDARTVALGKQRARRRALAKEQGHRRIVTRSRQAWSLLLDALVGYGYRTWLAGVWLLGFVLAGWWIFDRAHPTHLTTLKPPGERPLFHGGLYALDLLLPIGDLNYQGAWIARGWARGFWLAWILAGWVLTTAVLAALAGILKRD